MKTLLKLSKFPLSNKYQNVLLSNDFFFAKYPRLYGFIYHESIFHRKASASHTWCWQETFHPEEASSLSINNKQKLFDTYFSSLSARSSLRIKFYESSAFRRNLWIFKRIAKQIYECLLLNSRRCRPKCRT